MAKLSEIVSFLDSELNHAAFSESSLNGLQIEGLADVKRVAVAVDAGLSVIEEAIEKSAQLLIVHHGIFWGQPRAISGPLQKLVKASLESGLSLFASHLPLDAHPLYGNNALLAERLQLAKLRPAFLFSGQEIGFVGENQEKLSRADIKKRLTELPGANRDFVSLEFGPDCPERIAIVSGGGADALYQYSNENFDTLITGEPRQASFHFAKEHRLNALFAGHYATETVGVRRIGKLLEERFSIESVFVDQPTGI